jgi:hypothetical protein
MRKRAARFNRPGFASAALIALAAGVLLSVFAEESIPSMNLVDAHTAGILPKGVYQIESRVFPGVNPANGCGIIVGLSAGIGNRFNLGISYGGEGIIGRGRNALFNPLPGCLIKYRLFEENYYFPGVAIGFDYQGFGGIAQESAFGYSGYVYKSQGFFAAFSKSYLLFSIINLALHGDADFSLEEVKKVTWPNARAGIDFGFSEDFLFVVEYDFGLNTRDPHGPQDHPLYARPQDGYLHAGVRWNITRNFIVEADGRDLLEHRWKKEISPNGLTEYKRVGWSREIKFIYQSQM